MQKPPVTRWEIQENSSFNVYGVNQKVKWKFKIFCWEENQDGGVGRHTAPPRTTRTDRKSNGKEVQHQGNKK